MKVAELSIDLIANIARLQGDMNKAQGAVQKSMANIERNVQRVQRAFGALGLGVGFGAMISQATKMADAWQGLENRLRLVTNGQRELAKATDDVFRIAQRTSSGMDSVGQVYQRFAQNAAALGINLGQAAALTETVSKAVAVSGASASAAEAALTQFGQALASGTLRGDELNSIMEQTPGLAAAIAQGLGVTVGALRSMGAEGKITSALLVDALSKAAGFVDAQFETRVKTVGQAFAELNNSITKYVGQLAQSTGASSTFASAISTLADNIDGIARALLFLAATAIPAAVRALWSLAAAMTAVPGMALVKVLGVAAGALLAFGDKLSWTGDVLQQLGHVWAGVVRLFEEGWNNIKSFLGAMGDVTASLFGAIGVDATRTATAFKDTFQSSLLAVAGFMDDVYAGFTGNLAAVWAAFKTTGENIRTLFDNVFNSVSRTVHEWVNDLSQQLNKLPGVNIAITDGAFAGPEPYKDILEEAKKAFQEGQKVLGMRDAILQSIARSTLEGLSDAFDIPLVDAQTAAIAKNTAALDKGKTKLTEAQKAQAAFEKERQSALKSQYAAISALQDEAQALEDRVTYYGLSESALNDLTIARLREQQAALTGIEGAEEEIAIRERMIDQYQRIGLAMQGLEAKEAEKAAWESWSRDVEQIFQQVGQSLTDAIFEGGKSGRDLVKDLFKTLTLRVLINPVMNSIQGAVTNSLGGMFGLQQPQQGGMVGTVSNLGSAYNAASGGLTGNISNVANWVGEKAGSTALQSFASGLSATFGFSAPVAATGGVASLAGVTAGPGLAASLGTGASGVIGGSAAGIGSAIGAALPWVGGALAIGSLLGGSLFGDDEPKTRHGQRTTIDYMGGRFGVSAVDDRQAAGSEQAALAAAQASVTAANELFAKLGVDAAIESFYAVMESSVLGDRQGVASGGMLRTGDDVRQIGIRQSSDMTFAGFGGWSSAEMLPRLATDIQLSILEAFQTQVDSLPDVLADMIRGVDVRALDAAGAQDLAARFSAVVEGASSFLQLVQTMPFDQLRDLSFDAAAGLVEVAGGLQNLTGNLNTYYAEFHTEAERNANTLRNVAKALEEVGVALPDTRQQFRALVEAQDLTTDAGRRVYAALLNVSGAFASVTQSAEQAAQESQRIAEQNRQTLIGNLESAYSAVVSAGQAEIARLQQSFGATDTAMNSYRSAVQALESQFGSLFTSIDRYISDLRGNVEASAQAQYRQARAVISTALATGQLPQTADLTEALQVAQRGVTSQVYGSLFEQNRAYAILANEMEALKGIAEPELDAAKATLAQLEEQYALLRGTNRIAGDSLSAIEQQVRLAFATEEAARHEISLVEQQLELAKQQHEQLMEALTGIDDSIKSLAESMADFASAVAAAQKVVSGGGGGGGGGAGTPAAIDAATRYYAANPDVVNEFNSGTTGMGYDQYAAWHYEKYGQFEGRSYAVGTSYVPHDMLANIHQGEIIVNRRDSDILRRYGIQVQAQGGNAELAEEVRQLREENRRMNAYLYQITKNTKRTEQHTEYLERGAMADGAVVVY